jgi:hypothetical protein
VLEGCAMGGLLYVTRASGTHEAVGGYSAELWGHSAESVGGREFSRVLTGLVYAVRGVHTRAHAVACLLANEGLGLRTRTRPNARWTFIHRPHVGPLYTGCAHARIRIQRRVDTRRHPHSRSESTAHKHTNTHTCQHTYTCAHTTHAHVCVCVCVCVRVRVRVRESVCECVSAGVSLHPSMCACARG